MTVVWGIPYLLIRVSVGAGLAPTAVTWFRVTGAAAVLLPVALLRGSFAGILSRWRMLLVLSCAQVIVPFLLIAYGERQLPSSLTGVLIATEPIIVSALTLVSGGRKSVRGRFLSGLAMGGCGVVVLLGRQAATGNGLWSVVMVLVAATSYACAAALVDRVNRVVRDPLDPIGMITCMLLVGAVVMAPFALPQLPSSVPSSRVVVSLAVLALICTAIAFVAYFALIREVGAGKATIIFYVHPGVAAVLGVTVLGEPPTWSMWVGLTLILAGAWLATATTKAPRSTKNRGPQPASVPRAEHLRVGD
jgi:drug/metabolite transporter (DMT)-like permease